MNGSGSEPVLSSFQDPLRAIASVVLPSPEALDEEGWERAETIMEKALAPKPLGMKRQIRLFLRLVDLLPILSTGRTLTQLPLEQRAAFLGRLHRSSFMPLRKGLWGIRTLLFMGYYNQEGVRSKIGYAADARGWAALPGEELEGNSTVVGEHDGAGVDRVEGASNVGDSSPEVGP